MNINPFGWLTTRKKGSGKKSLAKQAPKPKDGQLISNYVIEEVFTELDRIPDPDDLLREHNITRGQLGKMLGDVEVGGVFDTRHDAVVATPWRLDPPGGGELDKNGEWLREQMEKFAPEIISTAWNAVPYGFSVFEAVYEPKKPGGLRGLVGIYDKPLDWFFIMRDGRLVFSDSSRGENEILDQTKKFFLTRRKASWVNPYGEALLSRLYWPWFFSNNLWKFWMLYLERFGDPLLVGKGQNPADMVDSIIELGFENVVAVGTDDELQAINVSAAGEFDLADTALARRIQKTVLGQTLSTETKKGGGLNSSNSQDDNVREDKLNADISICVRTVRKSCEALWALNNLPPEQMPTFVLGDVKELGQERSERDVNVHKAGGRLTKSYFMRTYDYQDDDIIVPGDPQGGEWMGDPASTGEDKGKGKKAQLALSDSGSTRMAAKGEKFTSDQVQVEKGIAQLLKKAGSPISESDLRSAVMGAKNEKDLDERLSMLLDNQDPAFAELWTNATFAAQLLGYVQQDAGK